MFTLPGLTEAYGYIQGKGTVDAIVRLPGLVTAACKQKTSRHAIALFFDLSKAFERARRLPVSEALIAHGVRGRLLATLDSWITGRQAKVRLQGQYTASADLECGVPQGSILSPVVFNVLVAHLVKDAQNIKGITLLTYADDIVAVANSVNPYGSIQKCVNILSKSANNLGLVFEPNKTAAMVFHANKPRTDIYLDNTAIAYKNAHKYLGVIFDRKLSFIPHAKYMKDKLAKRYNMFLILSGITRAPTTLLRKLYIAIVNPVIEYGAAAFIMANKTAISRVEIMQRRFIRLVLGVPSHTRTDLLYAEMNMLPFGEKIKLITVQYLALGLLKDNPSDTIVQTTQDIKDDRVFQPRTWSIKAGQLLKNTNCLIPINFPQYKRPSWSEQPILFNTFEGKSKREDIDELKYQAEYFTNNHPFRNGVYYTDGSLHADGKAGWGLVTPSKDVYYQRVQDHTPITLIELHAIKEALQHAIENSIHEVIIATDSRAAIQAIVSTKKPTYRETVARVHQLADKITNIKAKPVIVWTPGHCEIEGNTVADKAANMATTCNNTQIIEYTKSQIKTLLSNHFFEKYYIDLIHKSTQDKKLKWYIDNTRLPYNHKKTKISSRVIEHTTRLLRMGVYQLERIILGYSECPYCKQNSFSILHYLIHCPNNNLGIQSELKQLLLPEEHSMNSYQQAAIMLYRTIYQNPQYITALISTKPYLLPK